MLNCVYSGFVNKHHLVSQPVEHQEDENYQVGETTSPNYTDLNVQVIELFRLYADLTNYEEIPM